MTPSRCWTIDQVDFLVGYLCAMHGLMILNMFLAGGFLGTVVLLPLTLVTLGFAARFYFRQLCGPVPRLTILDLVFTAYLLLSLVSIVSFVPSSNPASMGSYLYGLNIQLLPMLTFFAAKGIDEDGLRRIVRTFLALQAVACIAGMVLFFTRPAFYTAYLDERLGFAMEWQNYARLQSYMGSTAMGILSSVAIVLLTRSKLSRWLQYSLALLFVMTVFLAQQRGAYVSGTLAIAYFLYVSRVSPLQIAIAIVVVGAAVLSAADRLGLTTDVVRDIAQNRLVDDLLHGDPFGERAVSWFKGLQFVSDFPLGLGLGATTSAADLGNAHPGGQVVDAYYMRIASDLGLPGLILFLLLLATASFVSIMRVRTVAIGVVIAIYAFQSVGTNVLDSFFVAHVFWMLLGYTGQRLPRTAIPERGWFAIRARDRASSSAGGMQCTPT